jgi:hypothetical protein
MVLFHYCRKNFQKVTQMPEIYLYRPNFGEVLTALLSQKMVKSYAAWQNSANINQIRV